MNAVSKGTLLIAKPFLGDPNFERGVVLLCDYNPESSFGFVLNQVTDVFLGDVMEEAIYQDIPLYLGGPVEKNTLHFIHKRPDLIAGGSEILEGVFWGGDFEAAKLLINLNTISNNDIRFFVGYSGWGFGQLDEELDSDESWIVTSTNKDFLFDTHPDHFWRDVLKNMGGEYKSIAHYPTDPRLN